MPAVDLHPSRQDLEAFSLGRLDDDSFSAIEEHLNSCPACQQVAAQAPGDSFTALLRSARTLSETVKAVEASSLTAVEPAEAATTRCDSRTDSSSANTSNSYRSNRCKTSRARARAAGGMPANRATSIP